MDRTTAADTVKAASSLGGPDEVCSGGSLAGDELGFELSASALPSVTGRPRAEAGTASCCALAAAELDPVDSGGNLDGGVGMIRRDDTCPKASM